MDAVTYPHEDVARLLADRFTCFKLNILERHPDFKDVTATAKVPWAPTLILQDVKGRELRRWVGWLPPEAFIAELELASAVEQVQRGAFENATEILDRVVERAGDTPAAPEALYWHGIARFLGGDRDMAALKDSWTRLVAGHSGTRWAMHASVIEDWNG